MPVYLGNSYKLAALRVYPIGKDPFYIENFNATTQKRFSNLDFLQFVEDQFFIKYGYKGA